MNEQSIDYILKRYSRNLNDLIELSIKLDEISLEQKKNITRNTGIGLGVAFSKIVMMPWKKD